MLPPARDFSIDLGLDLVRLARCKLRDAMPAEVRASGQPSPGVFGKVGYERGKVAPELLVRKRAERALRLCIDRDGERLRRAGTPRLLRVHAECVAHSGRAHGGVGDSRPLLNPIVRALAVGWLLRVPFEDHERQEAQVKASGLDWVIARPGRLTNGPARRQYVKRTAIEKVPGSISRADVADFLVGACEGPAWVGHAVQIGG